MHSLTVLTYNLHKGMSPLGARVLLQEMAKALQGLAADVLFLQEVQGRHSHYEKQHQGWPQHDYLAGQLAHYARYGMNAHYDHGHHGNAVLSRYPFATASNQDISVNRLERRGLLHTEIHPPGWPQPLVCLCGHFNLLARDRRRQYLALLCYIGQHIPADAPLILAGDFNDWRQEADQHLLHETGLYEAFVHHHGRHARTFPARLPLLTLDRIYLRGLRVDEATVCRGQPWSHLSDHLPLLARVSLADSGSRPQVAARLIPALQD